MHLFKRFLSALPLLAVISALGLAGYIGLTDPNFNDALWVFAGAILVAILVLVSQITTAGVGGLSFRTRLVTAFGVVSILATFAVALITTAASRNALNANAASDLRTRAQAAALSVGITMDRNVDRLQTMSLDKNMQDSVTQISDSYPAVATEREEMIRQDTLRWASADPKEAVIRNALNGEVANGLRQFGDVFQGNRELFVTDQFGSVIAATDWRPTYNFANESWWKIAFNNGRGSVYIGQPEYNDSINEYGIRIAVPVYAGGRTRAVGVVHSIYTLSAMQRVLQLNSFGQSGRVDLYFPQGQIYTSDGTFRPLTAAELEQVKAGISEPLATLGYRGTALLSGQGVVGVPDVQPEPFLRASAWRAIATILPGEISGTAQAGTQASLIVGLVAIGISILVALLLAQFLTRPIRILTTAAEQVQAGDLGARAQINSEDEIGTLAKTFNTMTGRLQETLAGLERRVAERTKELSEANLSLQANSSYLAALSDTSVGLFERLNLKDLLQAILERAADLMGTHNGFVFFAEPGEQEIQMRVGSGLYDDLIGTRAQAGVGMAGTVWQTGKPMVIRDYQKWEGRLPGSRRDALRAIVALPLKRGAGKGSGDDETVGVIGLAYTDGERQFGDAEVQVLGRFAQLASIALDNAKLYAETEARVLELGALNTISQLIVQSAEPAQVVDRIGDEIVRIFGADFGYFALVNPETKMIDFLFGLDDGKRITLPSMPIGQGITSQVITSGQPLRLTHASPDDYVRLGALDSGDGTSPRSLMAVPIRAGDTVIGALSVQRLTSERTYTEDDQKLLTTIAANIGVGIENVRLAQATQQRVQELSSLNRIGTMLNSTASLQERFKVVGRQLVQIFQVSSVYIALFDPARDLITMPFFIEDGEEAEVPPAPRGTGFVSHIIETRQPLVINDHLLDHFQELGGVWIGNPDGDPLSYLGVPITAGERVYGVVALNAHNEGRFTDADVHFLGTIAASIATTIDNERLAEETARRLSELGILNQVSTILTSNQNLKTRLKLAGRKLQEFFAVDGVVIATYDAATNMIHYPFVSAGEEDLTLPPLPNDAGFTAHMIATHEPILVNDEIEKRMAEMGSHWMGGGDLEESYVGVPILLGNQALGTLGLTAKPKHYFEQFNLDLLMTIGSVIASALQNEQLLEQTQERARELDAVNSLAREISQQRSMDDLFQEVYAQVKTVAAADGLIMSLYDDRTETLSVPFAMDEGALYEIRPEAQAEERAHAEQVRTGEPLRINDTPKQAPGSEVSDGRARHSHLYVPLMAGTRFLGMISLHSSLYNAYSERDVAVLTGLASHIAIALENARLFEQTQAALAETQRLAEREHQSATEIMALNRRLTREGWKEYLDFGAGEIVAEATTTGVRQGGTTESHGNGKNGNHEDRSKPVQVPIVLRGETIGTVELDYDDPDAEWSEDRQALVQDVLENFGLALDNARLTTETQRRVTELDALNQISQAVSSELELDSLLVTIGTQLRNIFDVDNAYIALYDRETETISLPYFINDDVRVNVEPIPYGEGLSSQIIRTRKSLLMNQNTDETMSNMGAKVFGKPALSYLGVPIFVGEEVTGVISIQSTTRAGMFDESNQRLLETIAATVGTAIQSAQLYGAMQQEVVTRQRAEEEIKLSLKEKEVLLKEIHHRVKNNLQIITSLLNLQSSQIKDPDAIMLFRESQSRVRSMALIHEKLYQSKDLARIDFDGYLRDLMVYLFRSYAANADQIRVHVESNNMSLEIDTAIPCGLMISELVTNTLKYAFPAGRRGNLWISIGPEDAGHLALLVKDDGVGFKEGFDWRKSDSLGLQLVSTLTSQLHGTIEVNGVGGTSFKITFPG